MQGDATAAPPRVMLFTESFPADRSLINPCEARGDAGQGMPLSATAQPNPRAARVGTSSATCPAMWPSVWLPVSPYSAASGNSPAPTLSSTITMARRNTPQGWWDEK